MNSPLQLAVPATAGRAPRGPVSPSVPEAPAPGGPADRAARASVSFAVALRLADGGITGFSTLAGSFTTVGIVAGLAGMDLVLLMLLLVARVPLIDGAMTAPWNFTGTWGSRRLTCCSPTTS